MWGSVWLLPLLAPPSGEPAVPHSSICQRQPQRVRGDGERENTQPAADLTMVVAAEGVYSEQRVFHLPLLDGFGAGRHRPAGPGAAAGQGLMGQNPEPGKRPRPRGVGLSCSTVTHCPARCVEVRYKCHPGSRTHDEVPSLGGHVCPSRDQAAQGAGAAHGERWRARCPFTLLVQVTSGGNPGNSGPSARSLCSGGTVWPRGSAHPPQSLGKPGSAAPHQL